MILHIPQVLNAKDIQHARQLFIQQEIWQIGHTSAGDQAKKTKDNLQIDPKHPIYSSLNQFILPKLQQQALYRSFALPRFQLPLMFNCYQDGGHYGAHVDSAIQYSTELAQPIRTDLSLTLFLSEPDEYEGGELVIEDTYGVHEVKLDAGDVILYPSTSLHKVLPVTSGQRFAAFSWVQSLVKDNHQRAMLFDLDMSILKLRGEIGDHPQIVQLTQHYHNLLRLWSEI